MTAHDQAIVNAYRATGRVAFYYPRKKLISLNGHKAISVKEAVAQMHTVLVKENSK